MTDTHGMNLKINISATIINTMASNFNYIKMGDPGGKAIIFLHGFMGCADDWLKVMKHLQPEYYCIAIDLPGHGATKVTGGEDKYKMEETAAGLKEFFSKKKLEKVTLCGYSMGGRLALYFAMKYPEMIDKLILESATPGIIDDKERAERLRSDELLSEKIINSDYAEFIENWYSMSLYGNIKEHPEYGKLIKRRLKNNKQEIACSLRVMSTGRMQPQWDNLAKANLPILLIAGEQDSKYIEINNKIASINQKSELRIISGTGHNSHFEKPEIFVNYIKEF